MLSLYWALRKVQKLSSACYGHVHITSELKWTENLIMNSVNAYLVPTGSQKLSWVLGILSKTLPPLSQKLVMGNSDMWTGNVQWSLVSTISDTVGCQPQLHDPFLWNKSQSYSCMPLLHMVLGTKQVCFKPVMDVHFPLPVFALRIGHINHLWPMNHERRLDRELLGKTWL